MSDAIETTAAGATRVLFGTIAFICLMVGIEGMTGAEKISLGLSGLLIGAGAICAYAAFFWETAKKVLSNDAQDAVTKFSRSNLTKASLLLAILISIISSPFIEQHRWPFSYPVDPSIISDNSRLKVDINNTKESLGREKELADKWRFAQELWSDSQIGDDPRGGCRYMVRASSDKNFIDVWYPTLHASGFHMINHEAANVPIPPGITIRHGARL